MVERFNRSRVQLVPAGAGAVKDLALPPGLEVGGAGRWSPDGRRIFICLRPTEQGPCRIWMHDGQHPWQVVSAETQDPVFAVRGDGEMVAARDPSRALWLFPVGGGPPVRIEGETRVPLQWTSDGQELIVRDEPSVPARLYKRDLRTGRTAIWREFAPADRAGVFIVFGVLFSDDMQTVVYQYYRGTNELYLAQGLR